jgi:hypothetical protein
MKGTWAKARCMFSVLERPDSPWYWNERYILSGEVSEGMYIEKENPSALRRMDRLC